MTVALWKGILKAVFKGCKHIDINNTLLGQFWRTMRQNSSIQTNSIIFLLKFWFDKFKTNLHQNVSLIEKFHSTWNLQNLKSWARKSMNNIHVILKHCEPTQSHQIIHKMMYNVITMETCAKVIMRICERWTRSEL